MVHFPSELKNVPNLPPRVTSVAPPHENPAPEETPPNKMLLKHVMNLMRLGNSNNEIEFHDQEMIIDKILELCQFYAISVPSTFKQAMKSAEREDWMKAIAVELDNLEEMRVWAVGQLPPGWKELNGHCVFATKPDKGNGVHFKARFVAKGFTQVAGVDFKATFAPTATFVSLCLLLNVAAANQWPVHSFDFVAAYLNLAIDKEI
jgi:hypothetical protein